MGKPNSARTADVIFLPCDPRVAPETTTPQTAMAEGYLRRKTLTQIARHLKLTLELTEEEAAAIRSYRRALEEGDKSALTQAFRDSRYDRAVTNAANGGKALDQPRIDKMTERYIERCKSFRANRIALAEVAMAANRARRLAWQRHAELIGIEGSDIRRFWLTAGDELDICRSIPQWNVNGVPMEGKYDSPIGPFDMPPAHPFCRCTERYERVAATGPEVRRSIDAGMMAILDYAPGELEKVIKHRADKGLKAGTKRPDSTVETVQNC
jgi:hypothetical protein